MVEETANLDEERQKARDALIYRQGLEHAILMGDHKVVRPHPAAAATPTACTGTGTTRSWPASTNTAPTTMASRPPGRSNRSPATTSIAELARRSVQPDGHLASLGTVHPYTLIT